MTKRIVIVTPGQLGSNPRVVKEATALTEAGFHVSVISTKVLDLVEARDQEIMADARWDTHRVAFDQAARWRAERLMQELAKKARSVRPDLLTDFAYSALTRRLISAACARPADLFIAHYVAALPAAARAAAKFGVPFGFDAEDFHPGDLPATAENEQANAMIRGIEGRYLPRAAYVTAASPGIAAAYADAYDVPSPEVVLNTFDKSLAPASPTSGGEKKSPSVYWFSQVRGPNRGLECAIEAIALATSAPHLYLRGTGRESYDQALRALAEKRGCAERLHFLDPAQPSRMVSEAAKFDLGLVGETGETENRRIALTNKQFTYLLAGTPALMSDVPAHIDFAQQAEGAAFVYKTDDARDLATKVDALLCDPAALATARSRAFALGQTKFNWQVDAPALVATVRRVLQSETVPA